MTDFKQQLAIDILSDNINHYYLADVYNQFINNEITQEEYNNAIELDRIREYADDVFKIAFKNGYLNSPINNTMIESKHIKFSGKAKIEQIKEVASAVTLAIHLREENQSIN
ncbi:hypothetical protein [Mammaliicoccus sciuri]|uniref:hypothetical protein n=1 Tax=Mammaliicoccus sciuri TaxID=1296 RepID=UPI002B259119|nr:hypothetical protein [Mammaliicoccus sciuri]WQK75175.1 hypothetical protein P3U33_05455 [Mammaliicoccus sciuri]